MGELTSGLLGFGPGVILALRLRLTRGRGPGPEMGLGAGSSPRLAVGPFLVLCNVQFCLPLLEGLYVHQGPSVA